MKQQHQAVLVAIEDAELDQVSGGLGSPVVPNPIGFAVNFVANLFVPPPPPVPGAKPLGLFGLGGVFGLF